MSDTVALAWQVLEICWINLLLSGDNAILIALACRGLQDRQRRLGMVLGALGAVGLRIAFTFAISGLLDLPGLRLAGGLFVIYLAIQLPSQVSHPAEMEARTTLFGAVRAIIVADAIMSMDNVLALAAAAKGSMRLIIFGLLLSAPLVMFGARFLSALMERFPILVWTGAIVLGWAGGELVGGDPIWLRAGSTLAPAEKLIGVAGAAFVLGAGLLTRRRPPRQVKS